MRRVLSVLILLCLVLSSFAGGFVPVPSVCADMDGVWSYDVSGGHATITGYTGGGGAVVIPDTLGTSPAYPVVTLGVDAFNSAQGHLVTSVTIPESVTSIGGSAFQDCTALTGVLIGGGVTGIGNYAFQNCIGLVSVTIPDSVISIGAHAFDGCMGLGSVTVPDSVTSIGGWAFYDCTGLGTVTIGSSVTTIGASAFLSCTSLSAAYFLGNAPTIGTNVFFTCAAGSAVWYVDGTTGWTNPWYSYSTGIVYLLTYTAGPHGSISGTLSQIVHYGADGTSVTAIPDTNYDFEGWSDGFPNAHRTDIAVDANVSVIATFASSSTMPGDVDGSGTVTMLDALLAARAAVGIAILAGSAFEAADVNHDGTITMLDVLLIARIAVGIPD